MSGSTLRRLIDRKDPIRNEPRVRVRIESLASGHILPGVGEARISDPKQPIEMEVYESEYHKLLAEVEDRFDDLKEATARAEEFRQDWAKKNGRKPEQFTDRDGFVEYRFRHRVGRDLRPLKSVTALEKLPPVKSPDAEAREQTLAVLVEALKLLKK